MKTFWKIGGGVLMCLGVLFMLEVLAFLNPKITKPILGRIFATQSQTAPKQVIFSQIPKEQFNTEFISAVQKLQRKVGDSLDHLYGLKKDGLLKSGIIWLGISSYSDSIFTFFDFFKECGCFGSADLIRLAPINRQFEFEVIVQKKMPWNVYWYTEPEDSTKSSSI